MIDHHQLRYLRIKKGFSQKVLADKLHIATNTLSDYENGKVLPNMLIFQKMLNTLGYQISIDSPSSLDEQTHLSREKNVKPDMEIQYQPYHDFFEAQENAIQNGILSSPWEFVTFVHKGKEITFLQNDVKSRVGLINVRIYKDGIYAILKGELDSNGIFHTQNEWATLNDIKNNVYQFLKHRKETEIKIASLNDDRTTETLNDTGKSLFEEYIFQKYLFGLSGEI